LLETFAIAYVSHAIVEIVIGYIVCKLVDSTRELSCFEMPSVPNKNRHIKLRLIYNNRETYTMNKR